MFLNELVHINDSMYDDNSANVLLTSEKSLDELFVKEFELHPELEG